MADKKPKTSAANNLKIIKLAPWIYNKSNFYYREHPEYHPDTANYINYWETHEQRSCEGLWVLNQNTDKNKYDPKKPGGYRFFTAQHYWYINFCFIKADEEGSIEAFHPDLRDIDFYLFYMYSVCWGFSGFKDDNKYTSHRLVKKFIKKGSSYESFTPKEKIRWKKLLLSGEIHNNKGEIKEYIDGMKYLIADHKEPKGIPLFRNIKENMFLMTSRRLGKSYFLSGLVSQRYNFHHKDTYKEYLNCKLGPSILVGSAYSSKSGELLRKFKFSQDSLVENFGFYENLNTGLFIPGFFSKDYMGSLNTGNEKNPYRYQTKYKRGETWVFGGTRTSLIHGTYDTNPQVFVGQATPLLIEDEVGLNDKLLRAIKADETTMVMKEKIGIMIKAGTGGEIKYTTQSKSVFYDPHSYQFRGEPDWWENEQKHIGCFVPSYYTDNSFRDKNGNMDIVSAYEQELYERKKRTDSNSTSALDAWIIARPLVPSEMFLSPEVNIFPNSLIKEHIQDLEIKKTWNLISSVGYLSYINKEQTKVKWVNFKDKRRKPILTWDTKTYEGDIEGSIVVYEHPPDLIPNPTDRQSMYKIGYDPVNDDFGGTSLASIIVYKSTNIEGWNQGMRETIVATYHGRHDQVDDIHDIAVQLSLYYNAKILPETNLPDFVRYCKRRGVYRLLQIRPTDAVSSLIGGKRTAKYDVGMRMMKSENLQGEQLIRQWLLEERGVCEETGKKILNLHHLYDLKLLDELINYERTNNTDAISAFKLLMFWIYQERIVPIKPRNLQKENNSAFDKYFKSHVKTSIDSNSIRRSLFS